MKSSLLLVLCLMFGVVVQAQNKRSDEVIARTYLLMNTVFGTKDSLTLEHLFAKNASYGHSGGKVEQRAEAIRNIYLNPSIYTDTSIGDVTLKLHGDVAIVRHSFKATETKKDGKSANLNIAIVLVWVKEKGKWRLFERQAVKLS